MKNRPPYTILFIVWLFGFISPQGQLHQRCHPSTVVSWKCCALPRWSTHKIRCRSQSSGPTLICLNIFVMSVENNYLNVHIQVSTSIIFNKKYWPGCMISFSDLCVVVAQDPLNTILNLVVVLWAFKRLWTSR